MKMRPDNNHYYIVTDGQQRQYTFQHHHQQFPNQNQTHMQVNRAYDRSPSNILQHYHNHQYPNASQTNASTKESIRLCNPFEESLSTSATSSSSTSNNNTSSTMNSYFDRYPSPTGYLYIFH